EVHAVREGARPQLLLRDLAREARLARPARTRARDEPRRGVAQQPRELEELDVTAHERRRRQVEAAGRRERRASLGWRRGGELDSEVERLTAHGGRQGAAAAGEQAVGAL